VKKMNESKKHEADDESNGDFMLDGQLQKFEQELRMAKPASPLTSPDAMLKQALSATQADRAGEAAGSPAVVDARLSQEIPTARTFANQSRWIAAIACSWLLGAVAGALAMWAASSRETGTLRATDLAENPEKTQSRQANQVNQNNSPSLQSVRLENQTNGWSSESSYRQFDIENLMGSTRLTVFNAKQRIGSIDDPFEPDVNSGNDLNGTSMASPFQNGPLNDSSSDSNAAPTTRTNLMKSLVF
jgi:hypothetical protein